MGREAQLVAPPQPGDDPFLWDVRRRIGGIEYLWLTQEVARLRDDQRRIAGGVVQSPMGCLARRQPEAAPDPRGRGAPSAPATPDARRPP